MKKFISFIILILVAFLTIGCTESVTDPDNEKLKANEFLNNLEIVVAQGDSLDSITKDISLPTIQEENVFISWSTNNKAITSKGIVTRGEEDVTVTLTLNLRYKTTSVAKEFTLVVKAKEKEPDPIPVATIEVSGDTEMILGQTYQLNASVGPANAANKNIEWLTSDETIITVDDRGNVTTIAVGEANIIVKAKDGYGAKHTFKVTVVAPQPEGPITIAQALALAAKENAKVKGTIIGVYAQGFMIYDGTDYMLVFTGKTETKYNVGEYVLVEGDLGSYKNRNQFTEQCEITKVTTGTNYNFNATALNETELVNYITNGIEYAKLVTVEFVVTSASQSYINGVLANNAGYGVCIAYPTNYQFFEVGKTYVVTGYSLYTSTYKNVNSLYLMTTEETEKVVEQFTVKVSNGELENETNININKFGYSGIYDADQSAYVWLITKKQIAADNSSYNKYERFCFKKFDKQYAFVEYQKAGDKNSIKNGDFDLVIMVTSNNTNLEQLKKLEYLSILNLDTVLIEEEENPNATEIGDANIVAKIATLKGESTTYLKNDGAIQLEALEDQEYYKFVGWKNVATNEFVTEVSSNTVVVPIYRLSKRVVGTNPGEFDTIQAAIDDSEAGDIIVLSAGVYNENIVIDKAVTIQSSIDSKVIYDAKDFTDDAKAAVLTGKILLKANNVKLFGLTFTNNALIGWNDVSELDSFVFENNYVANIQMNQPTWVETAYGLGATNETELWTLYPGFIRLSSKNNVAKNITIDGNVFENIQGTAIYNGMANNMNVTNNVFMNINEDAIRSDYDGACGNFVYANNKFEDVGAIAIYHRGFAKASDTTILIKSNMFKNCGKGEYATQFTRLGAISTYKRSQSNNVEINILYNVFDGNKSNLNIRANVEDAAAYNQAGLKFDVKVEYNAFITTADAVIQKNLFDTDSTSTNVAVGSFNNNFYGTEYLVKFDIADANFDNIISKDTTTFDSIKDLDKALPQGESLPSFTVVETLSLSEADQNVIGQYNPTLFVNANINESNNYRLGDKVLIPGKDIFLDFASAIEAAKENDIIYVFAGNYTGTVTLSVNGLTIVGPNAYEMKHSDAFTAGDNDAVLEITFNGTDIKDLTIANIVLKGDIKLTNVENFNLNNIYAAKGTVFVNGTSKNLKVNHYYYGGVSARVFYVQNGTLENAYFNDFNVMDSSIVSFDANGKYANGVCDAIRFGEGNTSNVAGKVEFYNSYFKGGQSGIMDRKPNADSYTISNCYFYEIPAAVYFRSVSGLTKDIVYTIQYNTFVKCGNSINDWDVLAVTTGANTDAKVNFNAFIDSFPYKGTATDYVIKIRTKAGKIDCANNYFKVAAEASQNLNATGLTELAMDTYYHSDKTYDLYQVVAIYSTAYVYGVNGYDDTEYAKLNRGSLETPLTITEAAKFMNGMTIAEFDKVNYGYVKGVVKKVTFNSKYSSYTIYITDDSELELQVYSATLGKDVKEPLVGDTIVACGFFELYYNNVLELSSKTGSEFTYPEVLSVVKPFFNIKIDETSSDKAEVTINGETLLENGSTFTFTVALKDAYKNDYKIKSVSINGSGITDVEGVYTATVSGETSIVVTVGEKSEKSTYTVKYDILDLLTYNKVVKASSGNTKVTSLKSTDDKFTFAVTGGTNSGNVSGTPTYDETTKKWTKGDWRIYYIDSPKGTLTISTSLKDLAITGIKISYTQTSKSKFVCGSTDVLPDVLFKCNGTSFTFNASVAKNCAITAIEITFEE